MIDNSRIKALFDCRQNRCGKMAHAVLLFSYKWRDEQVCDAFMKRRR